jgi:alkylated DNA repair dioxygenase AlkB
VTEKERRASTNRSTIQTVRSVESEVGVSSASLPVGWRYENEFIGPAAEASLLRTFQGLPFEFAQYHAWSARRRIVSYGGRYDFSRAQLEPAAPIPGFLLPLRERVAQWSSVASDALSHATIAEYAPGTQLGWHRDVPEFAIVIGVSLQGHARMRFRPYPHKQGDRSTFGIVLAPRSIYLMRGAVRWNWQHAISPTRELRYSITFRSRRKVAAA